MKVIKNYLYTSFYQIFSILVPLITTPYISRVLGVNGIGIAAATLSISQFFMSVSKLGIVRFGTREIASSDKENIVRKNFSNIFTSHLFLGVFVFIVYMLLVTIGAFGDAKVVLYIQGIYLLASMFDVSWFFYGVQNFKVTVTRGMFIKLSSLLLIFCFVKTKSDLVLYVLILATTNFLGTIVLWRSLPSYLGNSFSKEIKIPTIDVIKKTLLKSFAIFLPLWGTQLNTILDVIVLKIFTNEAQVGCYTNALKIVTIPMYLVTSLSSVLLPKISNDMNGNDDKMILPSINKAMLFMMYVAAPLSAGLIIISKNLTQWFLGNDFLPSSDMICILAIKIIFVSLNEIIGVLYLIPTKRNEKYSKAMFIGVFGGVLFNTILSRLFGGIGTSISYVLVEIIVFFVLIIESPEIFKIIPFIEISKNLCAALLMAALIHITTSESNIGGILLTIIQILIGIPSYLILTVVFRSKLIKIIYLRSPLKKVK